MLKRHITPWVAGSLAMLATTAFAQEAPPVPQGPGGHHGTAPGSAALNPANTASGILPQDLSVWGMFTTADLIVQAVMVGLLVASIITWTVWLSKNLELHKARKRAKLALTEVSQSRTLAEAAQRVADHDGPTATLIVAAQAELAESTEAPPESVKERAAWHLERIEAAAGRRIAKGTGILATIGATAPFVGLFGTVWGIMNSFIGIAKSQTTNLAVVAPGIAEALLATAFGLVAAIPAVVIYNHFSRSISGYRHQLGDASAVVLRLLSRDLDRRSAPRMPKAAE